MKISSTSIEHVYHYINPPSVSIFITVVILLSLILKPYIVRFGYNIEELKSNKQQLESAALNLPKQPILQALPSIIEQNQTVLDSMKKILQTPPDGIIFAQNIEDKVLAYTNKEREQAGLIPLQADQYLTQPARYHGVDMFQRNFFAHVNPDGYTPAQRIAFLHRTLIGTTGENIWKHSNKDLLARTEDDIAKKIVNAWMESPGHKANILNDKYTHLGVGISIKDQAINAVQNFSERQALLKHSLPFEITKGESPDLTTITDNNIGIQTELADNYRLWLPRQGTHYHMKAKKIIDTEMNVKEDVYQVLLNFVNSSEPLNGKTVINYVGYLGPIFIVK